jgi:hypothetical protein
VVNKRKGGNKMKKFQKSLLFLVLAVFLVAGSASATWYDFDFDSLGDGVSSADIELYMEGIPSDPGEVLINPETTTASGGLLGDDTYLLSNLDTAQNFIEIAFLERKILELTFDWAAENSAFSAYADGSADPFYTASGAFDTGVGIDFRNLGIAPVSTIKFTNNDALGYVALDNLSIENVAAPVPEPATMLLLGSGLIGIAGIGRKKLIRIKR